MRFLTTYLTLIVSELLFCFVTVASDRNIIGKVHMIDPPVTIAEVMLIAGAFSVCVFLVSAAIHTIVYKKIKLRLLQNTITGLIFVAPWVYIAHSVASEYTDMFGATWAPYEFPLFYFGGQKFLLGLIILLSAILINKMILARIDARYRKNSF